MNHSQRKILDDNDFWIFEDDYYYYVESYDDYYISYTRLENGLIDWSEEIPQSVKRQNKIDKLLNENLEDNLNNLGKFWPKNNI